MTPKYDLIVVGLGAMGAAALYHAVKRGANVLGIDRYSPPHTMGSSHGESRITRRAIGEGAAYFPLINRSFELWDDIEAATGHTLFHQSGGVIISPSTARGKWHDKDDFVLETATLAGQFGVQHERWSVDDLRENLPMLTVRDNDHAYYEPAGGVLIPEACIGAQLDLAQRSGATIHLNEAVLGYKATADGVSVQTDRETYQADKIVLAAGAWVREFFPQDYKHTLKIHRQVIYWFETDDNDVFSVDNFPFIIWIGDTREEFYSLFPIPPTGTPALKMLTEQYADNLQPDDVRRDVSPDEIRHFHEHFTKSRVPSVRDSCIHTGVCMYTVTPDEHFIIDLHPENERVVLASPCSGHGFKHSPAVGEILTQLALDGTSATDISQFSLGRFD